MEAGLLSILTVNIGAASRERAEVMLRWLEGRPEEVLILTETSAGTGTAYLLDQFRQAGYAVVHTPDNNGDRGTALVSQVPVVEELTALRTGVTIPSRVAAVVLDTEPRLGVLGVYVPSRDRSVDKTEKKETFVSSLLKALDELPDGRRAHLVIGGDYNVIARAHQPLHAGFLPFEFGLLETIEAHGFVDAHDRCSPRTQAYSWIGRTGDGYRYDYFHVGQGLAERITSCGYLHETREARLTDHAAVTVELRLDDVRRLETRELGTTDEMTLF